MLKDIIFHSYLTLRLMAFDKNVAGKLRYSDDKAKQALILPVIVILLQVVLFSVSDAFLEIMTSSAWWIYGLLSVCGFLFYLFTLSKISEHIDRLQGFKEYLFMSCMTAPMQIFIILPFSFIRAYEMGGAAGQNISFIFIIVFGYIYQWVLLRNYLKVPAIGAIGIILLYDLFIEYIPGFLIALHVAQLNGTI